MSTEEDKKQLSTKFYSTPLPVVRADWVLKIGKSFSLNDRVQRIHEIQDI